MALFEGIPQLYHRSFASWVRLEPRSRTRDLTGGVAARVADPLWMLARQWQVGELKAENAGSPIRVALAHESQAVDRVRLGAAPPMAFAPDGQPLEALVEREPLPMDWRMRVRIGQRFERLARARGAPGAVLAALYRGRFAVARPEGAEWTETDLATRRFIDFFAGRALDGRRLLDARLTGELPPPPEGMTAADVDALFAELGAWRAALHSEPAPAVAGAAWQPARLAYQFDANPQAGRDVTTSDKTALVARDYRNGDLDWHTVAAASELRGPWTAPPPVDAVPTRISVAGTSLRWWAFEDAGTDFGDLDVTTPDLSKLLLMELVLLYGDDWFSVPVPSAPSRLLRVTNLEVDNVFGEKITVPSARRAGGTPLERWEVFTLSRAQAPAAAGVGDCLFVPPVAGFREESAPLEEVRFLRDEGANMVWGVEQVLPNGLGLPVRGFEAQLERQRRTGAGGGGAGENGGARAPGGNADLTYRLATRVPENWIPFVPARRESGLDDGRYTVVLQRAQMLRNSPAGEPEPIPALSRLLGSWEDPLLWLQEHAVPRAGVRVTLTRQRARDARGRTWVWLGKKVRTGRGEGSSGLRFDRVT
jgi:hypothetical protein